MLECKEARILLKKNLEDIDISLKELKELKEELGLELKVGKKNSN
ncbi:MAG: hypothetical protein RR891_02530 [Clostridium sp.]